MSRSVSVDLPCVKPGRYSVSVSVVGERNSELSTVEDVIKRECQKRQDHDKLALVGYAYDLAHAKAVPHLEQATKLRKQSDQEKASSSRKWERRKLWEKRHLERQITKKQKKKNKEKGTQLGDLSRVSEKPDAAERQKDVRAQETNQEKPGDTVQTETPCLDIGEEKAMPKKKIESGKTAESPNSNKPEKPAGGVKGVERTKSDKPVEPDYSSDSPIEDWEELYSSDDMSKKPRIVVPPKLPSNNDKNVETDEEAGLPDPWNAICILSFRVYSKDKNLEIQVIFDDGGLQGGVTGEKVAGEIDNSQSDAAATPQPKSNGDEFMHEFEIVNGTPATMERLQRDQNSQEKDQDFDAATDPCTLFSNPENNLGILDNSCRAQLCLRPT
ncbi:hypothetical protein BX600DRAFT_515342 [Xylariales sp. PMI_506]|nr:hypothetical protein BX600DRAFT_515342 [Xylariales sp. PMI_506]